MLNRVRPAVVLCVLVLSVPCVAAKYKIKDLQVRPAADYAAGQTFQNLIIGAYPANTLDKTLELFDTDNLYKKGLMPILVVIENDGEFPVQISDGEIYLVDQSGQRNPSIPFTDVLLEINSKKSKSNLPNIKALQKLVGEEMWLDFEHKAFDEKIIAPGSSDHGVVFFRLPPEGKLEGYRLYFPEIVNITNNARLMFFEFDLQ